MKGQAERVMKKTLDSRGRYVILVKARQEDAQ